MKKLIKKIVPSSIWQSLVYLHCKLIRIKEELFYIVAPVYYKPRHKDYQYKGVSVVKKVHKYSMIDYKGLATTYDIAVMANELDGCFVECGVASGGCGALMAIVGKDKHTWLFDSYEGLPKPGTEDKEVIVRVPKDRHSMVLSEGYCLGTLEEVNSMLYDHFKLDNHYVYTVKGWFSNTLPVYKDKIGKIALLKLDADWYESVKCCFENLWGNIIEGGYIYIDDFHLVGCQKATDEFLRSIGHRVYTISDGRGGAWFRKDYKLE